MGIFINFTLAPSRISPSGWEKTYEDALKIADKCNLMDKIITERNGVKYAFSRKTAERDVFGKGLGICVVGTTESGYDMEDFSLYRSLDYYWKAIGDKEDNGADILFYDALHGEPEDAAIPCPSPVRNLWGGKTQGSPGHIPLLAIACLFADRFPDAVTVSGDITAGQCNTAVRLVRETLGLDIQPPVRCRPNALVKRIQAADMTETLKLEVFFRLYLGSLTNEIGEILEQEFGEDAVYGYFRDKIAKDAAHGYGMLSDIRDYLLLGLEFSGLLRLMVSDEQGCKMSLEDALTKLFSYNIHVPMDKKNCETPLPSTAESGDSEGVSSIEGMLGGALFMLLAGRNQNIPVYVPLDKIRASCHPLDENADAIIDRILKEREPDERQENAYGMNEDSAISKLARAAEEEEAGEKYDMEDLPDLRVYAPGDTFEPKFEESLVKCLRHVQTFDGDGSIFAKFSAMDREGRETWFLRQSRYLLLPETTWDHIFSHIMEDGYIHRYVQLFLVDCSKKSGNDVMSPLLCSPELVDLLWEKALAAEKDDVQP